MPVRVGSTIYFDKNGKGTWKVLETVRKAYLTFKRNQDIRGKSG